MPARRRAGCGKVSRARIRRMSLYTDIGGYDRVLALCKAWQARLRQDPLAFHPFERGTHPNHDERLAAYLAQAFGGPPLYTAGYGDETSMQRRHACNGEHVELDDRAAAVRDAHDTRAGRPAVQLRITTGEALRHDRDDGCEWRQVSALPDIAREDVGRPRLCGIVQAAKLCPMLQSRNRPGTFWLTAALFGVVAALSDDREAVVFFLVGAGLFAVVGSLSSRDRLWLKKWRSHI